MASIVRSLLPSAARLEALSKLRSDIFGTTFNPLSLRTGSKILKARLRGPAMLRYYGDRRAGNFAGLNAAIPGLELRDVAEETR
jgi:small subunit ribosomal protein S33